MIQVKRSDYITWDAVPEAISYKAALVNSATLEILNETPSVDPRVNVGTLASGQPAGTYGVRVLTNDGVELSEYSPQVGLEVLSPDYPTNIRKE